MSEYKISGETQSALIRAAGTLFAERGVAAVSVREITKLAGTQLNAVSYHFGGKDGLTAAVLEFVFRDWEPELLGDYVRSNICFSRRTVRNGWCWIYLKFYSGSFIRRIRRRGSICSACG